MPTDPVREEALRTLAEFARTAPGRLPQRVQDALAVAALPWESEPSADVPLSGEPDTDALRSVLDTAREALGEAHRKSGVFAARLSADEAHDLSNEVRLAVRAIDEYLDNHVLTERLTIRFSCPFCGVVNEPTRGEIVIGKAYHCDECMTALVFSVASPELDAVHDEVFGDARINALAEAYWQLQIEDAKERDGQTDMPAYLCYGEDAEHPYEEPMPLDEQDNADELRDWCRFRVTRLLELAETVRSTSPQPSDDAESEMSAT